MTREQFIETVKAMPVGQGRGATGQSSFVHITRTRSGYDVACGWIVPEAYDDDYNSCSYQPFQAPQPWVGRKLSFPSVSEAMVAYERYYAAIFKGERPSEGEVIGSVTR